LERGGKRAVGVWHRRAGKDDVILHWTAVAAQQRVGNYWHMLPIGKQARKAIWDAVNPKTGLRRIDEAFPPALRSVTRDQEMLIRFTNGSTWQVIGSDNYDSLVGSPPIGIVFSEWALADPQAWAYLRPILAENDGWAVFIYTPRGRNHGATFYETTLDDEHWFTERLTADETDVFTAEQLRVERTEYLREFGPDDGESRFLQEYYCDFNVAMVGSYYGRMLADAERDGRLTDVPHDPNANVETWWDLGVGDSTAIWFVQRVGVQYQFIDYYESHGHGLPHYARMLQEKAAAGDWVWGEHVWPHDGAARDLSTGQSRADTMKGLGFPIRVMPREAVDEGIHAVRRLLPMGWFDKTACKEGIEALRAYRREWDEKKRAFQDRPMHDWASHGADAIRTGALYRPPRKGKRPPRRIDDLPESHPARGIV